MYEHIFRFVHEKVVRVCKLKLKRQLTLNCMKRKKGKKRRRMTWTRIRIKYKTENRASKQVAKCTHAKQFWTACWDWKWWSCVHVQHRFILIERMAYRAPITPGEWRCCYCYHRCRRCWLSQHKFHNLYFRRLCAPYITNSVQRIHSYAVWLYIFYHYYCYFFRFVSFLSGEFKQIRVLYTKHVFCHLSFRLIDFLRARSFAFALIKNYGMRWNGYGCAGAVSYSMHIIVVVLVGRWDTL